MRKERKLNVQTLVEGELYEVTAKSYSGSGRIVMKYEGPKRPRKVGEKLKARFSCYTPGIVLVTEIAVRQVKRRVYPLRDEQLALGTMLNSPQTDRLMATTFDDEPESITECNQCTPMNPFSGITGESARALMKEVAEMVRKANGE